MTVLLNTLFIDLTEKAVRRKHPNADKDIHVEFQRYVDYLDGCNMNEQPLDSRWLDAKSMFLAQKAQSLGVGYGLP